jgi:hypothetical protein
MTVIYVVWWLRVNQVEIFVYSVQNGIAAVDIIYGYYGCYVADISVVKIH